MYVYAHRAPSDAFALTATYYWSFSAFIVVGQLQIGQSKFNWERRLGQSGLEIVEKIRQMVNCSEL